MILKTPKLNLSWCPCLGTLHQNFIIISSEFTGVSPAFRQNIELEHLKEGDNHSSAFPHVPGKEAGTLRTLRGFLWILTSQPASIRRHPPASTPVVQPTIHVLFVIIVVCLFVPSVLVIQPSTLLEKAAGSGKCATDRRPAGIYTCMYIYIYIHI